MTPTLRCSNLHFLYFSCSSYYRTQPSSFHVLAAACGTYPTDFCGSRGTKHRHGPEGPRPSRGGNGLGISGQILLHDVRQEGIERAVLADVLCRYIASPGRISRSPLTTEGHEGLRRFRVSRWTAVRYLASVLQGLSQGGVQLFQRGGTRDEIAIGEVVEGGTDGAQVSVQVLRVWIDIEQASNDLAHGLALL
jgi:hypothetical protein